MFELLYLKDNLSKVIYDVKTDKNGFPHFLIKVDNQWKYESAKHFEEY